METGRIFGSERSGFEMQAGDAWSGYKWREIAIQQRLSAVSKLLV